MLVFLIENCLKSSPTLSPPPLVPPSWLLRWLSFFFCFLSFLCGWCFCLLWGFFFCSSSFFFGCFFLWGFGVWVFLLWCGLIHTRFFWLHMYPPLSPLPLDGTSAVISHASFTARLCCISPSLSLPNLFSLTFPPPPVVVFLKFFRLNFTFPLEFRLPVS